MIFDTGYIDIYCERLDGRFWAEPLNALSNAAFFIAAMLVIKTARARWANGPFLLESYSLAGLIVLIGIGSFLFHTFATPWSLLADVIPIFIYKLTFLTLYARRIMELSLFRVAMLMLGFIILGQSSYALPKEWFNGSLNYAPALIFLLGYATYHYIAQRVQPGLLYLAAAVFTLSLTLRSIDMVLCDVLPIGVHYMWHILNAIVLYLTARAYIVNR
jgi:hypothetical protein